MTHLVRSLVFLLLVISAPALAQPADFRATYERGMDQFKKKEFAKARTDFLAAYALQSEPTVLFAIAQTYRFEGNYKEAIDWYKKFLADSQAAQDLRNEAQTYLTESQSRQQEIEEAARKAAATGPTEPDGKPAKMPTTTLSTLPGSTPSIPEDAQPHRTRRIPLGSKIAAGVAGAGLITALVVTKLGLDAEHHFKDLGRDATQADADHVERYQNLINLSWGVTAAAAATSVVIYFVAPSYATESKRIAIAPNTGDRGWSATFTGRF